jgi:outer membrane receptor protein involved in Fe transport
MEKRRTLQRIFALVLTLQLAGIISPAQAGTTGIISGTVIDAATGEKLSGVNIEIYGTNLKTTTDENGYFVITNVPPGDYKVTANLIGYSEAVRQKVSVLMDVTTTADFALEQSVEENEVTIVEEAAPLVIKPDVVPTMYIVTAQQEQEIRGQPNTLYQTPGLVVTQPGVVADEGGYPHIRGGRENQVGYMLDGIPITEPLTNGFGTNIVTVGLDKMEMYTGGYRPEYGNAISGIFNQVVKTGRTSPGLSIETLGGSQAFKGIYPQLGGVFGKDADYYVGAYFWHSELKGQEYNEVDCADLIGKFNYPLSSKSKLTLLLAQGSAKYQFPYTHTETYGPEGLQPVDEERDHTHQSYLLSALTFSHNFSSSSFITIRPYYFLSRNKVDALSEDIGYWWDSQSASYGLQIDYTNQVSEKHLLKVGLLRIASENRYWAKVPSYGTYEYTANTDTIQTGVYIQDQMRLGERWRADVGIRYDRMHYDKKVNDDTSEDQYSPRFGLAYSIDPKTNLRFSYGRMIQFVYAQAVERNYTDPMWNFYYGNADLKPERCTQYDLGWERQVSSDYTLQITPFYRKYKDLLQTTFLDPTNPETSPIIFDNLGEGTSKGIEILLTRHPNKNLSGWLSYTYSIAKAHASNDREFWTAGTTSYVDWDQRHTIALVLNHTNRKWRYTLVGRYGSGLPYGENNSMRAPANTVFDLNIARDVSGGLLSQGELRISISNLFNVGTVLDYAPEYDPETQEQIGWKPSSKISPRFISVSYVKRY